MEVDVLAGNIMVTRSLNGADKNHTLRILYEYADGNKNICDAEVFLDRPFMIRLMLEGETRLEINQTVRQSAHTYSYDNLPRESIDLVDPANIEDSVIAKLDREQLYILLSQLTDKQREAVELHHLCGLTQSETAKRLGTTREAVKARLRGALRSMERLLEKNSVDTTIYVLQHL